MSLHYTAERNHLILMALMREHGIRFIIVSPGGTNIGFVQSVQQDSFFKLYSCVDERSAAYMACGLAEEKGEPVAIVCTGATAARNYVPALTEAYYRKLPVLAITCTRPIEQIGNGIPQVTDRTSPMPDIALKSVYLAQVRDADDEWACSVRANDALLELTHHGGGPVHVNLMTIYSEDFSVLELPEVRVIKRYTWSDELPSLKRGNAGIYVGAHSVWDAGLVNAVERFCEAYDAVVLCDPTSNYHGRYAVRMNLIGHQQAHRLKFDTLVHMGEISGAYSGVTGEHTWRVSPDGRVQDTFRTLEAVFEMREWEFFELMLRQAGKETQAQTYDYLRVVQDRLEEKALSIKEEMPFSNIWVSMISSALVPEGAALHLAILNTLRSWSYFRLPASVDCYANTGGFGIDGCTSSLVGASLANSGRLYIGVTGDLAMFYDLNSLGNRHIGPNVRVMVINNGLGAEFKLQQTLSIRAGMGDDTDPFVAAAGHFGNKSPDLLRHIAGDLGFEYLCAYTKEEYLSAVNRFMTPEMTDRPMILEVFTNSADESTALDMMRHLEVTATGSAKRLAREILGDEAYVRLKGLSKSSLLSKKSRG